MATLYAPDTATNPTTVTTAAKVFVQFYNLREGAKLEKTQDAL